MEEYVADLEQRVTTREHEMSTLKSRVGIIDEDTKNIPDLIKLEFRLANSQIARLSRDVAELQGGQLELAAKFEAMPRAVAELVVELLSERDKKR
jgi:hypothetical protein